MTCLRGETQKELGTRYWVRGTGFEVLGSRYWVRGTTTGAASGTSALRASRVSVHKQSRRQLPYRGNCLTQGNSPTKATAPPKPKEGLNGAPRCRI